MSTKKVFKPIIYNHFIIFKYNINIIFNGIKIKDDIINRRKHTIILFFQFI